MSHCSFHGETFNFSPFFLLNFVLLAGECRDGGQMKRQVNEWDQDILCNKAHGINTKKINDLKCGIKYFN